MVTDMQTLRQTLQQGLSSLDLSLPQETQELLCRFLDAVLAQNQVMNLTAITDPADAAKLHLVDSLSLLKTAELSGKSVIDVGCGAGFPGVPLAVACPDARITLLDSLGKRISWLEQILPQLGISAQCITARAEEAVVQRREQFDIATSRAVARLNILLELTAPYVKVGGKVLAMKGAAAEEELAEAKNAVRKLGLKLEKTHTFSIDGANHCVLVFQKAAPTPPQYPRRYAKIKQSPL